MVVASMNNHQQHHITNMTKCVATCKNTADGCKQENIEGEPTASRSNARTVRQLTGEAAALGNDVRTVGRPTGETTGAQSVQTITGTVTEERRVEETLLNTWEQAPQQVEEIPLSTWDQLL